MTKVTKIASSESHPPAETVAQWQSAVDDGPREIRRKRVAVSLRRGLLRFVAVPPKNDGDPWIGRGRGAFPPASS